MKGTIVMPIGFMANFRGLKYREIEACFSARPITEKLEERCLAYPARIRDNVKELNRCTTSFDYLLPFKSTESSAYSDFVYERRYKITLGKQKLPSTASVDEFLHFMPCFESTLPDMLELLKYPDFYLKKGRQLLSLFIKTSSGVYQEFVEQPYCPSTWHGQGHPCITLPNGQSARRLSTLNWQELMNQLYNPPG